MSPDPHMITIDPKPGEELERYLVRVIGEARRSRTSVCASYAGVVFVITGTMSVATARATYENAKGRKDES